MKFGKKLVALLLMLAIMVVMAGCGDAKKLVGTWETTMDTTETFFSSMNDSASEDADALLQYLDFDKFEVTCLYTFNEDGTFSVKVDEDKLAATWDSFSAAFKEAVALYLTDVLTQSAAQQNMTLDDLMTNAGAADIDELLVIATGMTVDQFVDASLQGIDINTLADQTNGNGTYEAKDGNLVLTTGNIVQSEPYKLSGDTLTLTGDNTDEGGFVGLYPVVFTRVG